MHLACCCRSSVFHLFEAILEEEEGGALIGLLFLVGEAEGAFIVHFLTDEQLHLREFAGN